MHYNMTVDVWSVGCIMAELLTGRTLFPGSDRKSSVRICMPISNVAAFLDIHQLNLIMEILGTPGEEFMKKISSESVSSVFEVISRVFIFRDGRHSYQLLSVSR